MMISKSACLRLPVVVKMTLLLTAVIIPCAEAQGEPQFNPGLVAHYYKDTLHWGGHWTTAFPPKVPPEEWIYTKYLFTRVEPVVNHRFPFRSWFSVRWQGFITIDEKTEPASQKISFGLRSVHGCRLIINGSTVVSDWQKTGKAEKTIWAEIELGPGKHPVIIEAYFGKNNDIKKGLPLALLWKSEAMGIKETVIPKSALSHQVKDLVPAKSGKPEPGQKK